MARRKRDQGDWRNALLGIGFLGSLYAGFASWSHNPQWLAILYAALPLAVSIVLMVLIESVLPKSSGSSRNKSVQRTQRTHSSSPSARTSNTRKTDDQILHSRLKDLSWAEFERILALYFRDQGYEVEEVGIGGKDGGVDLVLTDRKTRERTAVQAKHWSDRNPVGPNIVRELDSSRKNTNPPCLYSWLITSSDVSQQARAEAEQRHMTVWHGGMLQHKLSSWPKWQPRKSGYRYKK